MSIDARVASVRRNDDGSGCLHLIDRPPNRCGDGRGIAGQRTLHFDASPVDVGLLAGRDVWGGANDLMLGRDRRIAVRLSYTRIRFAVDSIEEPADDHES